MWYVYTMKFYSVMKKNEILSFTGKWMELENIILSKVSQVSEHANIACSPSYADYRPKTNAVILLDMSCTLRGCMGVIGKWKETKNLNVVDVLSV
jgi:hypothetical protein